MDNCVGTIHLKDLLPELDPLTLLAASTNEDTPGLRQEIRTAILEKLRKTGIDDSIVGVSATIATTGNTEQRDNRLGGVYFRNIKDLRTQADEILVEAFFLKRPEFWADFLGRLQKREDAETLPNGETELRGRTIILTPLGESHYKVKVDKNGRSATTLLTTWDISKTDLKKLRELYHELKVFEMSEEVSQQKDDLVGQDFLLKPSKGHKQEVVFKVKETTKKGLIGEIWEWQENRMVRVAGRVPMLEETFRARVLKTVDLRRADASSKINVPEREEPEEKAPLKVAKPIDAKTANYYIDALSLMMDPGAFELKATRFKEFLSSPLFAAFTQEQQATVAALVLVFGYTRLKKMIQEDSDGELLNSNAPMASHLIGEEIKKKAGINIQASHFVELQGALIDYTRVLMRTGRLLHSRRKPRGHEEHLIARQRAKYLAWSYKVVAELR